MCIFRSYATGTQPYQPTEPTHLLILISQCSTLKDALECIELVFLNVDFFSSL